MAHIADILASMALAWPQVQFRLTHNGKVVKNCRPPQILRARG